MTISVRARRPERRLRLALLAACLLVAGAASAQGINPSPSERAGADASANASPTGAAGADVTKDQLVHKLVALTDVSQLQDVFTQQFVDRVESAMSLFGGNLDPQTLAAIRQQTREVVTEHINNGDALYSVLAPVYEKHFNLIELSQLVAFYQSPLGQKLVRVSPQLLTESLDLGQQWGLSLVPEIVARVHAQLNGQPIPKDDDPDDSPGP